MAVPSPRELCTEVMDGANLRSAWQGDEIGNKIICPMPRRVAMVSFSTGEFIGQHQSVPLMLECEAYQEILEIFCSQTSYVNSTSFGCPAPYFSGSPPCRAGNPIVRDKEFSHQRQTPLPTSIMHDSTVSQDVAYVNKRPSSFLSTTIMQTKSVVSIPTYRANPCVRVEGFDCPSHAFECSSRDMRRSVTAIA